MKSLSLSDLRSYTPQLFASRFPPPHKRVERRFIHSVRMVLPSQSFVFFHGYSRVFRPSLQMGISFDVECQKCGFSNRGRTLVTVDILLPPPPPPQKKAHNRHHGICILAECFYSRLRSSHITHMNKTKARSSKPAGSGTIFFFLNWSENLQNHPVSQPNARIKMGIKQVPDGR